MKKLLIAFMVAAMALSLALPAFAAKTEVRFAIILDTTIEEAWAATFIQALDRVAKTKPHGLKVSYKYVENISTTNAERVMKSFANTGKYDILLFHSGQYQDAVNAIGAQYPKQLVVVSGSGYKPKGGNILHLDTYAHEPAYLMGMMAGMMTKKNMVGAVAAFPYSNINLPVNAFFAGAKSVNPKCKQVVTYLETWFDPAKAKESAAAQIAAGADFIFAERFGVFEAAREAGIFAFGNKKDEHSAAPDVVLSSAISLWDADLKHAIDLWYKNDGKGYSISAKTYVATMAEGGSALAPYHSLESKVPQNVKDAIAKAKADIMSGKLKVPYNKSKAQSDN